MPRLAVLALALGLLLLVALGYDWLMAGVQAHARINEAWSIQSVIRSAFGIGEHAPSSSCFSFGTSFQDEKRDGYLTCTPTPLMSGLRSGVPQCDPVKVVGTSGRRDLPFTDSRLYFLIYVVGRSAADVQSALRSARALPAGDYVSRYTLNGELREAYFHSAPDPGISGLDCEGYSLTRLEYPAVNGPRIPDR